MDTEEVAAEVPAEPCAEPATEVKDANTEENNVSTTSTDIQDQKQKQQEGGNGVEGEVSKEVENPSCDWLEPLDEDCEDVDSQSVDGEIESLAGSEWSGSVVLKGTGDRKVVGRRRRRTQFETDDSWEEWPSLGQGWKRKEVFRRSGTSEGRSDTYYISPRGHKVRSRVELMKYLDGSLDLTNFDFKSGLFLGDGPRRRKRRKLDSPHTHYSVPFTHSFPSDSADAGGAACSPGSSTSLSCSTVPRLSSQSNQRGKLHNNSGLGVDGMGSADIQTPVNVAGDTKSPAARLLDINGAGETAQSKVGTCKKCKKNSTFEEGQTMCRNCRLEVNTRVVRHRRPYKKWGPCGRCQACQITVDCGKCVGCRNGRLRHRLNIHSRKVVKCRKRKCLHPVRKERGGRTSEGQFPDMTESLSRDSYNSKPSVSEDFDESQSSYLQYSDSEDLSMFFGGNDDNGLDEMGIPKVRRRSCGKCKGCVRRTDCGTCDFCMDKPKFGGRNKKRQKCRLRQCQREAMRHLLPMGETGMYLSQGWVSRGRPRYTYGRGRSRSKRIWNFEVLDNDTEQCGTKASSGAAHMVNRDRLHRSNYNGKANSYSDAPNSHTNNIPHYNPQKAVMSPQLHMGRDKMIKENGLQCGGISSRGFLSARPDALSAAKCNATAIPPHFPGESLRERSRSPSSAGQEVSEEEQQEDSCPSITQIFSVADSDPTIQGIDPNHELMPLLRSLRSMVLPVLWFCVVVEGPRLQLMQCSKRSTMADTVIHIEPSFHYHISVQDQPLLPTHKLYERHPTRLTTAPQIVTLLEDLESLSVCQGSGRRDLQDDSELVLPERVATCDFLIVPEAESCEKCRPPHMA